MKLTGLLRYRMRPSLDAGQFKRFVQADPVTELQHAVLSDCRAKVFTRQVWNTLRLTRYDRTAAWLLEKLQKYVDRLQVS